MVNKMRENSQILPEYGRSAQKKAVLVFLLCVVIFTCISLLAVVGDLYVYTEFSAMQSEVKTLELGDTFDVFKENTVFFPQNQIVVNILATVLCIWYIKKDTRTYNIGLAPSGRLPGVWLPVFIVSVIYAVIKIAWKEVLPYGLNYFFQMFAVAAVIALGVYFMRKANASNAAKLWIPFLALMLIIPFMLGNVVNSFAMTGVEMESFTDIFEESVMLNPWLTSLLAFLPGVLFMIMYYHVSGDLFGGIFASYLMSMMATSKAIYDGTYEISRLAEEAKQESNKVTIGGNSGAAVVDGSPTLTAVTEYGMWVVMGILVAVAVVLLIALICKKSIPSDTECEYVPLEVYDGVVEREAPLDELRHSSLMLVVAIASSFAAVYAFASTVWYNVSGFSAAVIDALDTLLSDGKLSKDFNFWVLISFIPLILFAIAFWILRFCKKDKTKSGALTLIKIGGYGLVVADIVVLIFMIVLGKNGFVVKYSELSYMWNALLFNMVGFDLPEIAFTVGMIAGVALLTVYHIGVCRVIKGILNPAKHASMFVYKAVAVGSVVIAAILVTVSFFAMQSIAMVACAVGGVACVLVAIFINKLGIQQKKIH